MKFFRFLLIAYLAWQKWVFPQSLLTRRSKTVEKNHKSISRLFALNISHFLLLCSVFPLFHLLFFHNQLTARVTQPATVAAAATAIVKLFSLSHEFIRLLSISTTVSSHHPSTVHRNENSLASRFLSTFYFRILGGSSRFPQDALIYDKFDDTTAKAIFCLHSTNNRQHFPHIWEGLRSIKRDKKFISFANSPRGYDEKLQLIFLIFFLSLFFPPLLPSHSL